MTFNDQSIVCVSALIKPPKTGQSTQKLRQDEGLKMKEEKQDGTNRDHLKGHFTPKLDRIIKHDC